MVCASSEFIKLPLKILQHATALKTFTEQTGCEIPHVVGVIYRTHIDILAQASESKADYHSR